MSSSSSAHVDCEFTDKENAQFYCNAYFAWEFERLREEILVNPKDYVQSLAECEPWKTSGGKSGLHFYKTKDDRFILKEMSGVEFNCFQEFAPHPCKILGVYKIGSKNSASKETHKMDFLVIENVFFGREISEKYDLKGSMRNRLVDTRTPLEPGGNLVLMDENLLKLTCNRPLFIRKSCQKTLLRAIDRDTSFLQGAMIMDYSLI
ncbi:FYVE finger-containing phosphoinositide kinase_ putative, partial [Caligus rogercresseyi]